MLNLQDLSISDLQSYLDGLKEAVELIEKKQMIYSYTDVANRCKEAQRIIDSRFKELEQ